MSQNESHPRRDFESRLSRLETLMDGTVKDGEKVPGVMDTLRIHSHALFGDRNISSTGVVQAVEKLTTVLKVGTGVMIAFQVIGWAIALFHK